MTLHTIAFRLNLKINGMANNSVTVNGHDLRSVFINIPILRFIYFFRCSIWI